MTTAAFNIAFEMRERMDAWGDERDEDFGWLQSAIEEAINAARVRTFPCGECGRDMVARDDELKGERL